MAALANELPVIEKGHVFNASADVFRAKIEEPIERTVNKQAFVELPRKGGYEYQQVGPFRIEGLISYQSGYTQVAGSPSTKHGGVTTLSTSVLEGLNVHDILTADRVVAQIFTEHPEGGKGQVPSVSFLGTRFENLRIAGEEVKFDPCTNILGPKPDKDRSYFEDKSVLDRVEQQYLKFKHLPAWAQDDYEWERAKTALEQKNELKCSLFENVSTTPGHSFGHVIDVPFFGKIVLGELTVNRKLGRGIALDGFPNPDTYSFHLTMINLKLGCPTTGNTDVATADSNGQGSGTGGHGKP